MRGSRIARTLARARRGFGLFALVACGSPSPSSPSSAPPPAAPPSTASTAAAPVAPIAPPSPFSLFTEGWEVAVADIQGPVVIHDGLMGAMITVEGERVTRVDRPFYGLPAAVGTTAALTGKWPEGAFLTIRAEVLDTSWGIRGVVGFFRRSGGSWQRLRGVGRSVLDGVQLYGPDDAFFDARVVTGFDGRPFVLPYPYVPNHRIFSPGAGHELRDVGGASLQFVHQIGMLANGEIVVLGRDQQDHGAIQRLRPDRPGLTNTRVTDGSGEELLDGRMCRAADNAVHLVGWSKTPRLAFLTLQGSTWDVSLSDIPLKPRALLAACALGHDGSVWLVFRSRPRDPDAIAELFRRLPSGVLERVPYPSLPPLQRRLRFEDDPSKRGRFRPKLAEVPPSAQRPGTFQGEDVFVAGDGSIWLSGRRGDDPSVERNSEAPFALTWRVVLRLGPPLPEAPTDWGTLAPHLIETRVAAANVELNEYNKLYPPNPKCASFLSLAPLPKTPPASEDFSRVRSLVEGRADLSGTQFIEARVEDVPVLGALVPDPETGKRLLALLKARVPAAKLSCGRPRVLRVIPMGIPGELP